MSKIWVMYLFTAMINFILVKFDFLSNHLSYEIWSAVMVAILLLTVFLAGYLIHVSPNKKRTVVPVLFILLISHYKFTGMVFALIVWKINGFSP